MSVWEVGVFWFFIVRVVGIDMGFGFFLDRLNGVEMRGYFR